MEIHFVEARIQPCKERDHPAYLYDEEGDATREAPEEIPDEVLLARLFSFFAKGTVLTKEGCQKPYSLTNPRPEVRFLSA